MRAIPRKTKRDNTPRGFSSFGFSTILITFAMICIVTFAALALVTANSDYLLSRKVEEKTQKYFDTDIEIYSDLTKIDATLHEIYDNTHDEVSYYERVTEVFSEYESVDFKKSYNNVYTISFSKDLSEKQSISVAININYPKNSKDSFYTITSWETITDTTVDDDPLNLIGS